MVDGIDLIFVGLNNALAIFFIFGMAFTVFGDDRLDLLDNVAGLIDSLLEAWFLGLDFDTDLYEVFGLLDLVLDIKNDPCAFFLLRLFCLDCRNWPNCE